MLDFYLRFAAMFPYCLVVCLWGCVVCVLRWGDTNLNRDLGRVFAWGVLRLSRIRVEVEGRERLESSQPCVYVANHQSNLDVAIFGSIFPGHAVGAGKKEIRWIPIFGLMFEGAGNLMIDRANRSRSVSELDRMSERVRKDRVSVWLFPEGTRNEASHPLLPFKKGAFHLALRAGVPIVPVVSSPVSRVMDWRGRRMIGGTIRVKVLEPVDVRPYTEGQLEALVERVRDQMSEAIRSL